MNTHQQDLNTDTRQIDTYRDTHRFYICITTVDIDMHTLKSRAKKREGLKLREALKPNQLKS